MMKRRQNAAKLRIENLENRNLMAGDVAVQVTDGALFVTGDQESNGVELVSTGVEGQYIVTGLDAGDNATTVNGETAPLVVDGVTRSIHVRLGDGDDTLQAPNLSVDGPMRVRMGQGDDAVHIGDVEADEAVVEITRGLSISLGDGDDRVGIANVNARGIRVSGGAGNDEILARNTKNRIVRVAGQSGDDDIRVNNVHARHIGIRSGLGDDSVRVVDSKTQRLFAHLGLGDDNIAINGTDARRIRIVGNEGVNTLETDLALADLSASGFGKA